jgi:hypothetical protein
LGGKGVANGGVFEKHETSLRAGEVTICDIGGGDQSAVLFFEFFLK